MLTQFNPDYFEIFAYSNHKAEDIVTQFIRSKVNHWRNISDLTDDEVITHIHEDKIDILVDLSGHSEGNRLLVFARKPAPIQITAWGYIGGTGMKAMDVFFADPVVVSLEEKSLYAEQLVYLPAVVCYFPFAPFPPVNPLPALSGHIITFGSFNRLAKVTQQTFQAWAQVLLAVPGSRMIFKTQEIDQQNECDRLLDIFSRLGVSPECIVLQGNTAWGDHMAAYNQIDISLDPFPHGGGVTTIEGIMMGVPVVTLRCPTIPGRISAAVLTPLGLTDWIAETPEEYVDIAVRKSADLMALSVLRKQLRNTMTDSLVGNPKAYTQVVEQQYRLLWQQWCQA
jgi:predicted O-linked N-acetylglucosamine transferase (SPINDLY family)